MSDDVWELWGMSPARGTDQAMKKNAVRWYGMLYPRPLGLYRVCVIHERYSAFHVCLFR